MEERSFTNCPVDDGEPCRVCSEERGGPPLDKDDDSLVDFEVALADSLTSADVARVLVGISMDLLTFNYCVHPVSVTQVEHEDGQMLEVEESPELRQLAADASSEEEEPTIRVTIRCGNADLARVVMAMKDVGDTPLGRQFRLAAMVLGDEEKPPFFARSA